MTKHYAGRSAPCCRMAVEEASNALSASYLVTVRIASSFVDPPVVGDPDMVLPT
jgi:hypothetical protein